MEWEIPIPPRGDDPSKPDWSICQLVWWLAISEVYAWSNTKAKVPMRLTLEMRIMGRSEVTMAPQHGNDFGTCSIEVLTTINTDRNDWAAFMQAVTDLWTGITDASGNPLNVRPHWAKEWCTAPGSLDNGLHCAASARLAAVHRSRAAGLMRPFFSTSHSVLCKRDVAALCGEA